MPDYVVTQEAGGMKLDLDDAANDSDKSFTTPAGKEWRDLSCQLQLTTTAVVGTRYLRAEITDGTNIIRTGLQRTLLASVVVQLSLHGYGGGSVGFSRFQLDGAATQATAVTVDGFFFADIVMRSGYVFRVRDAGVVDVAGDDMIVSLTYREVSI